LLLNFQFIITYWNIAC